MSKEEEILKDRFFQNNKLKSDIEKQIYKLEKEILRLQPLGTPEMYNIIVQKQVAISNLYIALSNLK